MVSRSGAAPLKVCRSECAETNNGTVGGVSTGVEIDGGRPRARGQRLVFEHDDDAALRAAVGRVIREEADT